MEALLTAREVLRRELNWLHLALLRVVKNDELCRRFMTIPGVGPVTALAFKTTIDRPERFRRSAMSARISGSRRGSTSRARSTGAGALPDAATPSRGRLSLRPPT
jgi:transposase